MKFYYEKRDLQFYAMFNQPLEFPAHLHKEIELVYIKRGKGRGWTEGVFHDLNEGEVFLVFPDTVHYYDECREVSAIVSIFSVEWLGDYGEIFNKMRPISPHIKDVPSEIKILLDILEKRKAVSDSRVVRGLIVAIMGILLEKISLKPQNRIESDTLIRILEYCRKHYREELTVAMIAKDLNLSASHISHTFSNKLHMSFRDYVNSLRVTAAAKMLTDGGKNITEIAYETGFNSVRTFDRAFKKQYEVTPLEYKKRNNVSLLL